MWQQWISAIIGLGIIATPFLGMTVTAMLWTLVIAGIVLVVLSLWSAYEISSERDEGRAVRHAHS